LKVRFSQIESKNINLKRNYSPSKSEIGIFSTI